MPHTFNNNKGLAERITACESLTFFAEVLLELKEKLEVFFFF